MKPFISFSFAITILCLTFLLTPSHVQAKDDVLSEKDLTRFESIGTLSGHRQGAMPKDFWTGTQRSLLMNELTALSKVGGSPVIYGLKKRILLSQIDASKIKNDIDQTPDNNIFTLRLKKLNELGAFEEALTLYSKLETPFNPTVGQQGLVAMIGALKPSLACLELKAMNKDHFGAFEKKLGTFCDLLLSEKPEQNEIDKETYPLLDTLFTDSGFIYTPKNFKEFQKKDLIEKVALLSQNKMDFSKLERTDIHEAAPEDISLLLSYEKLPGRLRIPLSIEAAQTGVKPYNYIKETFLSLEQNALDEIAIHETEKSLKDWQKLPFHFGRLNASKKDISEEEVLKSLKQALDLTKTYGVPALYPFAPYLTKDRIISLLEQKDSNHSRPRDLKTLTRLFILTQEKAPEKWEPLISESSDPLALLLSRFINKKISKNIFKENTEKSVTDALKNIPQNTKNYLFFLASALDKEILFIHNPAQVYEKQIDLTISGNYVMPSVGLADSLFRAKDNNNSGETVLLNVLVLQYAHPGYLYPGMLGGMLKDFETVGLNKEAHNLMKEIMFELSEKLEGE